MAKSTKKTTSRTTTRKRAVASGDQAPETKSTAKAQSDATQKLFDNADQAALAGLPPDMTVEQRENQVRKAALGY